jgi:hypothetical protein
MVRPLVLLAVLLGISLPPLAATEVPAASTKKDVPLTDPSRFGPPQAQGEQTAEMKKLTDAGFYEGHPSSLTFIRWKGANPPTVFHAGLWGPKVTNEHAALLPSLSDLESLEIHETSIDDSGAQHLARLPKLRRITISSVDRFQKIGFPRIQWSYPWLPKVENRPSITGKTLAALRSQPALEFLDLRDTRIVSSDLAALASFQKLGEIGLPNALDTEALQHLASCKQLSALILGNREIKPSEIQLLAKLPSLKRLTIRNAQLSNETLAELRNLENLTALGLYDCGITDEQLAHLAPPPLLTHLELVRNEIAGPGLASLATFSLKKLDLMFNNLSDASLSQLSALRSVEDLSIAYCTAVTDEGIQSGILQQMTHLKTLELRGLTHVTDTSLAALSHFGHLKLLGIREAKISWDSVDKMRAAMPKTQVFK